MKRSWPSEEDSTGNCLSCHRPIDGETGVMIDLSYVPKICEECWAKLSVKERMELAMKGRLFEKTTETLDAVTRLCEGALDGYHTPRGDTGEAGRN